MYSVVGMQNIIFIVFVTSILAVLLEDVPLINMSLLSVDINPIYEDLNVYDFDATHCEIDSYIQNCSPQQKGVIKITRYREAVFPGSVFVGKCDLTFGPLERTHMKWEIWKLGDPKKKVKDIIDKPVCLIEEDSLDYGIYKLKLITDLFFHGLYMRKTVAYCFFEVKQVGTQTIIWGGYLRTAKPMYNLNFNVLTMLAPGRLAQSRTVKVLYRWSCQAKKDFCKFFQTTHTQRLIIGPFFEYDKNSIKPPPIYHFNLSIIVESLDTIKFLELHEETETQTVVISKFPGNNFGIVCQLNCGGSTFSSNSQEVIQLEAKIDYLLLPEEFKIVWFYRFGNNNETEVPKEALCNDSWLDWGKDTELRIRRDFLKEKTDYLFSAILKLDGNISQRAEIKIFTSPVPSVVACKVDISKRFESIKHYNIKCIHQDYEMDLISVKYEFYNRDNESDPGRHLGFSDTGILEDIIFTKPKLYIYVVNFFGTYYLTQIKLNVSYGPEFKIEQEIEELSKSQTQFLYNYDYYINVISAQCDFLANSITTSVQFKFDQIDLMLEKLNHVKFISITRSIMLQNVLDNIISVIKNTETKKLLKSESINFMANIMNQVSSNVKEVMISSTKSSRFITTNRIYSIVYGFLECSNFILDSKDDYDLEDLDTRNNLKKSMTKMVRVLKNILTTLEFQQSYAINRLRIDSKSISLRTIQVKKFEDLLNNRNDDNYMMTPTVKFHLNEISFEKDVFWWSNGYEINTCVKVVFLPMSLSIVSEEKRKIIQHQEYDFELKIYKLDLLQVSGKVKQPNPIDPPEIKDIKVAVHRIKSLTNSVSFVNFTYVPKNTSLRVVVLQGQRPDFDYMNDANYSKIITTNLFLFSISMTHDNKGNFFYIGVLPGPEVEVGEEVEYNFTVNSAACRIWRYDMWTATTQCSVTMEPIGKVLHCVCPLGSEIIAGYLNVPSHQFNPFSDIRLFVSDQESTLIVPLLLPVCIVYFILLLWTRNKDKKDKEKLTAILLDDNDPRDQVCYLIGVFTGCRIGAGTTSNIGIRLFGTDGFSRPHILNSFSQPPLKRNSDNWYLAFANRHLGTLTNILVWTDYSGNRPDWYCSKIFVFNFKTFESDFFFIETWFGISTEGVNLVIFKECATFTETNNVSRIISENLLYGTLEMHYWLTVFCKHPRSPVTRSQRLNASVCGLIVNILLCISFYYPSPPEAQDFSTQNITQDTIVIGIVGSLFGCIVSLFFTRCFQMCFKITKPPLFIFSHSSCPDIYHFSRRFSSVARLDLGWLRNFHKFIIQSVNPVVALPLQSPGQMIGVEIHTRKIKVVMVLCVLIMVICCHFIVAIGLHYSDNEMYLVGISLVISILETNLIIAPMKILIMAIIFGCTYTRYYEINTFHIELRNIIRSLKRKNNRSYMSFLDRLRATDMYKASLDIKFKKLTPQKNKFIWSLTIYYTISSLSFLCVAIFLIQLFKIKLYFLMNKETFCSEFGKSQACQSVYHYDLNNVMEFWDSLSYSIIPRLYTKQWYNGQNKSTHEESFQNTGWMVNGVSRLVGVPRLRQIRAKPSSTQCSLPKVMVNISHRCNIPTTHLSEATEDTRDYGVGWSNNAWHYDLFYHSPWKYTAPTHKTGMYLSTPSDQVVHDGGYIATLNRDLDTTKTSLSYLFDTNWINDNSRIIITDFTMYTANTNVFTETNIVTEMLTVGSVKVVFYFKSITLSYSMKLEVLFLLMVTIFSIQILFLINIMGTQKFFSNFWNIYDILVLFMFLCVFALYCDWLLIISDEKKTIERIGREEYLSINAITGYSRYFRNLIGVLFSMLLIRLLRIIRFQEEVRLYSADLFKSTNDIFYAFLITFMIMFVQFRFIMFLTVPPSAYCLKDVLVFKSRFKQAIHEEYTNSLLGKFLAYLLNFTSQLGIFTIMMSQNHHYKKAQKQRLLYLERKQMREELLLHRNLI